MPLCVSGHILTVLFPGRIRPQPPSGTPSALIFCQQRRNSGYHRRLIDIFLRHTKRLQGSVRRLVRRSGSVSRQVYRQCWALIHRPDAFHWRGRHHFNMFISTTWANHLRLLIYGWPAWQSAFQPRLWFPGDRTPAGYSDHGYPAQRAWWRR